MVNPYFCYVLAFSVALLVYMLGWSRLYPTLSAGLLMFLLSTIAVHLFAGIRYARRVTPLFTKLKSPEIPSAPVWITVFLYMLWSMEFLYEGGIPLLKIIGNRPYDYRLFGIPSLHVFMVTFGSFYTIYLFHLYISQRRRLIGILFLLNLFAAILIYSRAMFIFNLVGCFFILLTQVKISRTVGYIVAISVAILLYLFGVMGTLRVSRESGKPYDNGLFMDIGDAKESFRKSVIPKEYFWAYIYITSPVANLQYNIDTYKPPPVRIARVGEMVNNEILMDFISKRINTSLGIRRVEDNRIHGPFNVSTAYSRCYSYQGWEGVMLMAVVILLIPLAYLKLIPKDSPFFLTGFVTLCTMYLFLAYDNTIRFTGLSFQIAYPIVFHHLTKRLPVLKKIFLGS